MKTLFYKILAVFGAIFAIFQLGKRSGKTTLRNEINKNRLEDVKKTNKLKEEIRNLDIDSARRRLQKYARK
jgi:hypothetical protein